MKITPSFLIISSLLILCVGKHVEIYFYHFKFNDYWYKIIALGGVVIVFLYGELKANIEKEVENKVKEKELKDKR